MASLEAKAGANLTRIEKDRLEVAKKRSELSDKGMDEKQIDRVIKKMKTLQTIVLKIESQDAVKGILEPFREFSDILDDMGDKMDALSDPAEKLTEAFIDMKPEKLYWWDDHGLEPEFQQTESHTKGK